MYSDFDQHDPPLDEDEPTVVYPFKRDVEFYWPGVREDLEQHLIHDHGWAWSSLTSDLDLLFTHIRYHMRWQPIGKLAWDEARHVLTPRHEERTEIP